MRLFVYFIIAGFFFTTIAYGQITIIPQYNMSAFNQNIANIYKNTGSHSQDIVKRISTDSRYFIGAHYFNGALGEGPHHKFDKSPLYRTDEFDCTTFVSTVLTLVESNNLGEFKHNILKVRYKNADVAFVNRNHFISVDWNNNNEANGYLQDINNEILDKTGKPIAVTAKALIDKPNWYRKLQMSAIKAFHEMPEDEANELLEELHDCSSQVQAETSKMLYLPFDKLFTNGVPNQDLFNQIPSGVVVEIVRPNWDLKNLIGTNLNISHMGIGIRINGVLIFREASSIDKRVEDIDLEKYLEQFLDDPAIKGIRIEKIMNKARAQTYYRHYAG